MAFNKILLSDNVTELANVKSVVFKEAVNADVNIRSGCVGSASIEVEVYGSQATAVSVGDVVYYYQIDKNNVQTLIGEFVCEPTIKTKTSYKFIAYDNAQKLNADFSQWLQANQSNFPMTVYALVSAACTEAGVTLGSSSWGLSTQSVQAFYSGGITCRDILSYAAEIGCCFVRCHADGSLYFDWYSANANTIAPSVGTGQYAYKQDGLNYANFTTATLDRVAVHPSGEDDVAYIYPTAITSGNTIHIQNNLLLTGADAALYNAVAQNVYTVMSALGTYRPMTASLFAKENPFRAGDIVSVTDAQSVTFTSVITGMTVSDSGAVLESTGNETYDEGTGNTQKAITQLASDVVRINKLKVDWADINTAIINYLTTNNVTAQNLTIVDANNVVLATFNASGIRIGQTGESHMMLDSNSFELYDKDGNVYASIGDMRDASGATIVETQMGAGTRIITTQFDVSTIISVTINGTATTSYTFTPPKTFTFSSSIPTTDEVVVTYETTAPVYHYDLGQRKSGTTVGGWSISNGYDSEASGNYSVVSGGSQNVASGTYSSVNCGNKNTASGRASATCGGNNNTASGNEASVVGGTHNTASGGASAISGGGYNIASGGYSAVCGGSTNNAQGTESAILGGDNNSASGRGASVVGGQHNVSNHRSQFVFGEYNSPDPSTAAATARGNYVEIVGNGASGALSNARTLDWSGNETLSGGLTLGIPLAIANGGTGANSVSGAKNNLGFGTVSSEQYQVANGSSIDVPIASSEKGIIVSTGSNVNARELIWYYTNSSGTIAFTRQRSGSTLTITASTNKLTFANATGAYCYICKFIW